MLTVSLTVLNIRFPSVVYVNSPSHSFKHKASISSLCYSMCLIYNHTFCLLTSIYVLLNYASARPILFSLVLNFMYGNLNLTVLFKFIVYMFCLLIVRVYFYVGFKCSLEFCFNCLFLVNSKYILLHCIVLLHYKFVCLVNLFCP
jgi:hypothetical protein